MGGVLFSVATLLLFRIGERFNSDKKKQPVCFPLYVLSVPGFIFAVETITLSKGWEENSVWAASIDLATDKTHT